MSLLKNRKNIYSQNGEDGILEYIFKKIQIKLPESLWCVEFGAWDGKLYSNTFLKVETECWNAVYIESDDKRYEDLLLTVENHPNINPIKSYVEYDINSDSSLDNLLKKTAIPNDYELLSIDIDSYDLAVWNSYTGTPKVVVIEINSSLLPGVRRWHDGKKLQGNSFSSTLKVGIKKGYTLVCHTGNLIFVRNDLVKFINLDQCYIKNPNKLFIKDFVPSPFMPLRRLLKKVLPHQIIQLVRKLKSRKK